MPRSGPSLRKRVRTSASVGSLPFLTEGRMWAAEGWVERSTSSGSVDGGLLLAGEGSMVE